MAQSETMKVKATLGDRKYEVEILLHRHTIDGSELILMRTDQRESVREFIHNEPIRQCEDKGPDSNSTGLDLQMLADRVNRIDRRVDDLHKEVYFAEEHAIKKGDANDPVRVLLKGRVDNLERELKALKSEIKS